MTLREGINIVNKIVKGKKKEDKMENKKRVVKGNKCA